MLTLLTMLAWIATWCLIGLRLRKKSFYTPSKGMLNAFWLISLLLHGLSLFIPWITSHTLSFDFLSALSLVLWLTSCLIFITQLTRPLESLGLVIIPIILPVMGASVWFHNTGKQLPLNNGLGVHIFLSLIAYSLLALAALQALLLAAQNRQLHNHNPGGLIRTLPPLQDMETLLFRLIQLGWILLTLGLGSGLIYLDGLFGRQVAHKTILSIFAWLTFAILLYGRWRYGWRGRIAIRWTLIGFVLLMLAFFGSKFVLEYLVTPS